VKLCKSRTPGRPRRFSRTRRSSTPFDLDDWPPATMNTLARFRWPILLAILGVALETAALVSFLGVFRDSGTLFFVPGEVSINIKKPGTYTLWHEAKTFIEGQFMSFPDDLPSGTTIKVLKQPDGTPVSLRRGSASHMEKSGTRRVAIGKLTFNSPGHYRFVVDGLSEKRAFYLQESKFLKTFLTITICGFVGLLFFVAAIGSGIYVFIQIINARRNPPPATSVGH
jgi:hypothetical protein